jgi:hypothetical protein
MTLDQTDLTASTRHNRLVLGVEGSRGVVHTARWQYEFEKGNSYRSISSQSRLVHGGRQAGKRLQVLR